MRRVLVTLTLNPAVDRTQWVERVVEGAVHHALQTHLAPGGKGINVSRMAHRLGWPTVAFGFLAGESGNTIEKALEEEGVQQHFLRIPGQTRVNVTLVDKSSGEAQRSFGPGPAVPAASLVELSALVRLRLQGGRVLVLAGSLPPGVPDDTYASYIRVAHEQGLLAVLDTHGAPLRAGLEARPDLIKPNVEEAEGLLERRLPDAEAVIGAARELAPRAGTVVISMGARGAICFQGERGWCITPPKVEQRSTVGRGDAMVAGLSVALARGDDILAGLRLGTAAGAATAMSASNLGTAKDVDALLGAVVIEPL